MQLEVDVRGRPVVVFGTPAGARRVLGRYRAEGARATLAQPAPLPSHRVPGVRHAVLPDAGDTSGLLRLLGPTWCAVLVDVEPAVADRVRELGRRLRVLVQDEAPAASHGQVVLVGGGPGPRGLLTEAGRVALREADVVLYDRLGPTADLVDLAPTAELVDVGKSPDHHPVTQRAIEALMVARARAGDTVVRLKGGDPFVLGRGGEEVLACRAAGVEVRVVPGVSSALAVPAAGGIPVTHRGTSHAFTVISGHVPPSRQELAGLVGVGGTLVVLMGIAHLDEIVAGLLAAGMAPTVPAAVVERGFSPSQRTTVTTVGQLPVEARRRGLASPAVVVVGEVVTVTPTADAGALLAGLDASWSSEEAGGR
jgi:uroporphyrin-III C-methyltransferase